MVRPIKDIYLFPADGNGSFVTISDGVSLDMLIGETLTQLMCISDDCTNGMQLVRLKFGDTTIVAHKRFHDIKVTIYRYKQY